MKWNILDTGPANAQENMALDHALLRGLRSTSEPVLHFYDWEGDAATYGHFLDPYTVLNKGAVERHCLELARRPTGGGVVFHTTDFAYSILVPAAHPAFTVNTLENYAFVHHLVAEVVHCFTEKKIRPELLTSAPAQHGDHASRFCMARPTQYDVMWKGRKVGGGAQRRTRWGFLHQGTLSLALPDDALLRDLLLDPAVHEAMRTHSHCFFEDGHTGKELAEMRNEVKRVFGEVFGNEFRSYQLR